MRRIDRIDKVSDNLHDMREVLPMLFTGSVWEEKMETGAGSNERVLETMVTILLAGTASKAKMDQAGAEFGTGRCGSLGRGRVSSL